MIKGIKGKEMAKRKAISNGLRFDILRRDNFTCQYCGAKPIESELVIDHINPVANGGTNEPDNLITSCHKCNSGKSNKSLETGKRVSDGISGDDNGKTVKTCFRLHKDIKEKIDIMAKNNNVSTRHIVEQAIRECYIDKKKEEKPNKNFEERLERYKKHAEENTKFYKEMYEHEFEQEKKWSKWYMEQVDKTIEMANIAIEWKKAAEQNKEAALSWKKKAEQLQNNKKGLLRKMFGR